MTDLTFGTHYKVVDESWPTGHCSGCGNGHQVSDPEFDYLPWSEAEARNHPGMQEAEMPALDYDPYQHRRRLALSRAQLEAILDLREDVHIFSVEARVDPMWVYITTTSPRFQVVEEHAETRVEMSEVAPTAQGPRWHEPEYLDQSRAGRIQNEREPGWMEGWRAAIEWLETGNVDHMVTAADLAEEMKTRLPE